MAAGLAILAEGGDPAALGLREAARRAGVSAMAPYRHFSDKDALLAAVATVGFERLRADLEGADRGGGEGQAALIAQGVAYVAFAASNPGLIRLMFKSCAVAPPEALSKASSEAFGVLAARVATLVPAEQARDEALRCWSLVHGMAVLALDGGFGAAVCGNAEAVLALAERLLHLDVRGR